MANPYYRDREPPGPAAPPPRMPYSSSYSGSAGSQSGSRPDPALEQRKLFIGGIAPTGIDADVIRYDFSRFGEIEDCFVPADRNEQGRIRGIAFVTYRDAETARVAIREMHNRNYHGREITVNIAKPRGADPKKDGSFHTDDKYSGKFDAGGRLRAEYRGTIHDPERERNYDPRYDREDLTDAEREREYRRDIHSHGNSYDGTGRYGERDPRPRQAYYD